MPLIFGQTSSGLVVPVLVEADGALQPNNKGYIGAAWQKNPLSLGYSGDKTQEVSEVTHALGNRTLTSDSVPAGEIWILEAASARNKDKISSTLRIRVIINGVQIYLLDEKTVAANTFVHWSGAITLSYQDTVSAIFYDTDADDDIYLQYHARRIDIDQ